MYYSKVTSKASWTDRRESPELRVSRSQGLHDNAAISSAILYHLQATQQIHFSVRFACNTCSIPYSMALQDAPNDRNSKLH